MVPTPQILSSVLTADLSPSRCLVVGLLLTAGCNVLASLAPGDGATKLVLILAGALDIFFWGPKWEWTRFFLDQKGLVGLAECCLSPKPTFISCLVSAMIWEKTLLHSKPMFWCDALIYFHGVSLGLLAGPVCHFLGAPTWQVCGPSMVSSRAWEVLPVPASSVPGAAPRRRGNLRYL